MEFKEFTGKTVDDAITEAQIYFNTTSDKIEYEIIEKGSIGLIIKKPAKIKARKKEDIFDRVRNFLDKLLNSMGVEATLNMNYDEIDKIIDIEIVGNDMGILIGKRGQTLDSLQYLTSLVVNKGKDDYVRVKVDTENYRKRRKETLENLAKNLAYKVKRTKRSVTLEPMNPYERRVIHSALQNDKYVSTHSEGEEPYRRVVITLNK